MTIATITLTPDQVASVIAQAGTTPLPPQPQPVPPNPPDPPSTSPVPPGSIHIVCPFQPGSPRQYTGPITSADIICVEFKTGSKTSNQLTGLPRISGSEYQSPPRTRIAVLSKTPGDFGPQTMAGASSNGTTVSVPFTVSDPNNWGYYPILDPSTTYYLNVKSANPADNADQPANMAFDLTVPGGMAE
jgi:hypothetical protein